MYARDCIDKFPACIIPKEVFICSFSRVSAPSTTLNVELAVNTSNLERYAQPLNVSLPQQWILLLKILSLAHRNDVRLCGVSLTCASSHAGHEATALRVVEKTHLFQRYWIDARVAWIVATVILLILETLIVENKFEIVATIPSRIPLFIGREAHSAK